MPDKHDILAAADRCVMCGMCTPSCPTYLLDEKENESPRGRISLIQGLYRGQLKASRTLQGHLDHCLGCRACETLCPSSVPFSQIMDQVREDHPPRSRLLSLCLYLFAKPQRIRLTAKRLRLYRASGIPKLLAALGYLGLPGLRRLHRLLKQVSPYSMGHGVYPAHHSQPTRGSVTLFSGCADSLFDQQTKQAAITLLNRLGYVVEVSHRLGCCGALHQHAGAKEEAMRLAQANLDWLGRFPNRPLLHTSSACASQMQEYSQLLGEDVTAALQPVADIGAFLQQQPWPANLHLRPLRAKVAVHEPCLQRNVSKQGDWAYQLLQQIPGIELVSLPENAICCGAAGSYMLTQPQKSEQLGQRKIAALRQVEADIIVSSNIGCALQLRSHLGATGEAIEVLHPIALLARQLGPT